jgi:hypothetical protein
VKRDVTLPDPRPVQWPLRDVSSATVTRTRDRQRTTVRIEHEPLREVTARMLRWWYGNVPGTMIYAGKEYPRYQVWHPLDHISYEVVGGRAADPGAHDPVHPGSNQRIREALQRKPDQLIDIRVSVEELAAHRAVIVKRVLGTTIVRLENDFSDGPHGADYHTTLTVGDDTPLARAFINRVAHRRAFPEARIGPWVAHHVEEIGNLEHFLPQLYAEQADRRGARIIDEQAAEQ